jgi:hypothetical protein
MRRDEQRLLDIIEAVECIGRILAGRNESVFIDDETLRFAVAQRLIEIGEAAAHQLHPTGKLHFYSLGRHCRFPQHSCPRVFGNSLANSLVDGDRTSSRVGEARCRDHAQGVPGIHRLERYLGAPVVRQRVVAAPDCHEAAFPFIRRKGSSPSKQLVNVINWLEEEKSPSCQGNALIN